MPHCREPGCPLNPNKEQSHDHLRIDTAGQKAIRAGKYELRSRINNLRLEADLLEALCNSLPEVLTPDAERGLGTLLHSHRTMV